VLIAAIWHGTYNLTVATAGGHGMVAAVVSTGVLFGAVVIALRSRRRSSADSLAATSDPSNTKRTPSTAAETPVTSSGTTIAGVEHPVATSTGPGDDHGGAPDGDGLQHVSPTELLR